MFLASLAKYEAEGIEETYGALNAYWAMLPGNSRFNVRQLWLQNNHYADLSFVFALSMSGASAQRRASRTST